MTPPNYFRFVRVDEAAGGDPYDGYTLHEDESFQTFTGWGITNYSAAGFSSHEDESFQAFTGWGITNYSAAGFSSHEDINFESGSLGSPTFAFDVVDSIWWT